MGRDLKPPANKRGTDKAAKTCATCKYWLGSNKHTGEWWHYICTRDRAHIQPESAKSTVCDGWNKYSGTREI